jgi:streptogramin lyase
LRFALIVIVMCLTTPVAGVTVIGGATITPVEIPTPRTINPDVITRLGPNIAFFNSLVPQAGTIDEAGTITTTSIAAGPGEKVSVKSATMGPDGNLWFAATIELNQAVRSALGRVHVFKDTITGTPDWFQIPSAEFCSRLSAPCDITAGPGNTLWLTGGATGKIARATTAGVITEFQISGSTLNGIASGGDGHLWVTSSSANRVYDVSPAGAVLRDFRIAPERSFVAPADITPGPDERSYFFAEVQSGGNRIGMITTAGVVTEFAIPTPNSNPVALTAGSDGLVYFVELNAKQLGQLNPATGEIRESPIPNGFAPDEIVAFPPDAGGNVRLVLNTLDPATFDSTPQRVEIGGTPVPDVPDLTIEKLPSGDDLQVDDFDEDSPRFVRHFREAAFFITVRNVGKAPTAPGWQIVEKANPGFYRCRERPLNVERLDVERKPNGDAIFTPKANDPFRVLAPGDFFSFTILCRVFAETTGPITNVVEVLGGGSSPDSSSAQVIGLTRRDADRLEQAQLRLSSGR